jgi:tetratricopeptide (TPR) repeat protein
MAVTCDICGVTSDLDETFTKARKSFRFKKTTYCPACWLKRQTSLRPALWWWGIFLFFGIVVAVQEPQEGWFLLNLFFTGLCTLLLIIPHELGHAFMARWLGIPVFKIIVGSGHLIKVGTIFGFPYEARQFPFHGLTLSLANSRRWYRLKRFCIVIAGPLVNLGLLLVALRIPQARSLSQALSQSLSPVGWLILANAWILFINLIPHHLKLHQGKIPNDGLSLLTMPFLPKKKIEQTLPLYYVFEGSEFLLKQQFQQAKISYLHGLSQYPQNLLLKNGLGIAHLEMGEVEEARTIFAQLLEKSDASNKGLHSLLLNNLAYANILSDPQGLVEEADALSSQVYQNFPWVPAFKGTRGIVLVELGELDEGIALLKQAMEENEEPRNKAIDAAYLAIAEGRKGDIECAKQYLKTAKQFDATCSLINQAQNEVLCEKVT